MQAVQKQLDAKTAAAPPELAAANTAIKLPGTLDAPTFAQISGILATIESDLENVDAAPTDAQTQVVTDTTAKLDAALATLDRVQSRPPAQAERRPGQSRPAASQRAAGRPASCRHARSRSGFALARCAPAATASAKHPKTVRLAVDPAPRPPDKNAQS